MPSSWYSARGGKASLAASVSVLVIMYAFGLAKETWVVVYRSGEFSGGLIGSMGIFKACGFNTSLDIPDARMHKGTFASYGYSEEDDCFSMFEAGVPGWVRAFQFFAILVMFLLCVLDILWIIANACGNITDERYRLPLAILWITTGVMAMVHPIIFACHIRPSVQVIFKHPDDPVFKGKIVITSMYWGAFILHCLVAGAMNVLTLIILLCVCCVRCL